jgi:hypothetical protein
MLNDVHNIQLIKIQSVICWLLHHTVEQVSRLKS